MHFVDVIVSSYLYDLILLRNGSYTSASTTQSKRRCLEKVYDYCYSFLQSQQGLINMKLYNNKHDCHSFEGYIMVKSKNDTNKISVYKKKYIPCYFSKQPSYELIFSVSILERTQLRPIQTRPNKPPVEHYSCMENLLVEIPNHAFCIKSKEREAKEEEEKSKVV